MVANTNATFALNRAVELLIIIFNQESTGDSIDDSVLVNKIINGVNSLLTARKDNVYHMTTVDSGTQAQFCKIDFYLAMVNAFPSSVHQTGLDLANRNILWSSITSAGIPLPIDSESPYTSIRAGLSV